MAIIKSYFWMIALLYVFIFVLLGPLWALGVFFFAYVWVVIACSKK